ncbi:ABC transporter permease [Mycoplasma marinum]|uniref:Alkylphosphonate ABC transporter permease n=1 Tax=Mycoplasma marinum TaxID=1937190 RepID=A0A4R0XMP0_9MOLU|nr:ABC transporter permease subunit [Mycoplasma marinum]TCG10732.1 alkylphosphonate ABC transporter permease [Mycoplasma marinum]
MKLKNFNNYKIVNINGQVVKKKSPWPKILIGSLITVLIILVFLHVQPNFKGHKVFAEQLGNFFKYDDIRLGLDNITISQTFFETLRLLWKTILYSLLGTVIGVIISIPLSLVSSKNITKKWYVYMPFRIVMSLIRSIPPLIVAYLMFNVFSQTLSATLALSVFVTSIMTKWLFEELDSIDLNAFVALQALGNQKNRSITMAVFPHLIKSIVSYGVYAFEMVIRFAAILGVVGIATVGSLLSDKYKPPTRWGHMSIVLLVLIITIVTIEILSMLFKKYIMERQIRQVDIDKTKSIEFQIAQVKYNKSKIWITKAIVSLVLISLIILSITSVDWSIASQQKLELFNEGIKKLMHPEWKFITDFGTGVNALELGFQAVLVAIAASIIGLFLSFFFGILASKAFMGRYFSWIFKIIIISVRAIPAFVYAIIFLFLSPSPNIVFAGVLALGVHSIGMLGKLTYEKLDSIDLASRNALEVMGVNRIISTKWALLKEAKPTIISNAIYRIEINFKSMVQIGAVGASLFGFQIGIYSSDPGKFSWLAPYLLVTIAFVLALEQISNILRKKIMTGQFFSKNNFFYKKIHEKEIVDSLIFSNTFNLSFDKNQERIKFNNYIGRLMIKSKENKLKYFKVKKDIKQELKELGFIRLIQKYE